MGIDFAVEMDSIDGKASYRFPIPPSRFLLWKLGGTVDQFIRDEDNNSTFSIQSRFWSVFKASEIAYYLPSSHIARSSPFLCLTFYESVDAHLQTNERVKMKEMTSHSLWTWSCSAAAGFSAASSVPPAADRVTLLK